jgi:hypothetical protein
VPEVVDVQVRKLEPPVFDPVHQRHERGLLFRGRTRPASVVSGWARLAAARPADHRFPELDPAKQVLEPGAEGEGISLEIEEQIARGRQRQTLEAGTRIRVEEQLVARDAARACTHLQARLLADAAQRTWVDALDARRRLERGQRLCRADARQRQPVALAARDAGHERRVVVRAAALFTGLPPAADVTMFDRLGVRLLGRARDERFEAPAHPPMVSEVVGAAQPQWLRAGIGGTAADGDPEMLRHLSLDRSELLGVNAQLDQGARLGVASELRVHHFVSMGAERGPPRHPDQKIGAARPLAHGQRGLVDDTRAGAHGLQGRCGSASTCVGISRRSRRELHHIVAESLVVLQNACFVGTAAALEQQPFNLVFTGPAPATECHLPVEIGEVRALGKTTELGGGKRQRTGAHARSLQADTGFMRRHHGRRWRGRATAGRHVRSAIGKDPPRSSGGRGARGTGKTRPMTGRQQQTSVRGR